MPLRSGIEEVDRLDAALARGAQQGAKRLASERDFAADASHQLRTPLTALLMRLEEIASTDDLEVVEEEANIAIDQVERLSRVVDDLMSRTRSGTETNPAVSLDSVLASLQREWQPAFAGARRSIHVSGERGLGVRATPDRAGADPDHAARELADVRPRHRRDRGAPGRPVGRHRGGRRG